MSRGQSNSDLEDAIAELKQWRNGFSSIHVKYRTATPNDVQEEFPGMSKEEIADHVYFVGDWYWNDLGNLRSESLLMRDSRPSFRVVEVANAARNQSFRAEYRFDDAGNESLEQIWLYAQSDSVPRSTIVAEPLYALWNTSMGGWLGDGLSALSESAEVTTASGSEFTVRFWTREVELDLRRSALPRRLTEQNVGWSWEAYSFRRYGGTLFPSEGILVSTMDPDSPTSWKVTSVDINLEFPATLFHPPEFTEGATVWDTVKGQVSRKRGAKMEGGEGAVTQREAPSEIVASAAQPWQTWRIIQMGLFAIGILCIGIFLLRFVLRPRQ
jgi:hypothetical protein